MKLGCVSYINALPLTSFLDSKKIETIARPPAQLLELLLKGEVEAALLPIVNYFETPGLSLVPEVAIAARGPVQSVKLFLHKTNLPIEEISRIYLDEESRTSQDLLRVLLHHFYHRRLEDLHFLPKSKSHEAEASLLIGDKALFYEGEAKTSFDLGELWWKWTEKPFVFAAWMTKGDGPAGLKNLLQKARDEGVKKIDQIIESITTQSSSVDLRHYFTNAIHYYMGPEELDGIRTFYQLLKPIRGYTHDFHFKLVL